jgi:dTDP-4-dehydrorhamnose reductase
VEIGRMKILVAGSQGQLARALVERGRSTQGHSIVALGRPQLDLLDTLSIARLVAAEQPELIINAAAYTAVDNAEREPKAAFSINRDGAGGLAAAAREIGAPIVHISTDYVFDGTKSHAYVETDATCPIGVYGSSKLEGEAAVATANPEHLILRTSWLFSPYGHNFLKTMLRLAAERPELRVVADQFGNPTYAPDLADAILALAFRLVDRASPPLWGIYHAAGTGDTSWHGFATEIVRAAARTAAPMVAVVPVATCDYPTLARRPANSQLNCDKFEHFFGARLPPWQQSVGKCIESLRAGLHGFSS